MWTQKIGERRLYKATMKGTSTEWQRKIDDIEQRGHIIVRQGKNKYDADVSYSTETVSSYWAEVKIPN